MVELKTKAFQKKRSSKFLEEGGNNLSGGAANLRSAPGGRHPSYATDSCKDA